MKFFAICLTAGTLLAQTQINLARESKDVDFSAAPETRPEKTGTTLPASCNSGDLFFLTNATAGSNLYGCLSTQWYVLSGGSGGGGGGTGNAGATVSYTVGSSITMTCPSPTGGTVVRFEPASGAALSANATVTVSGCTGSSSLSSLITVVFLQAASGGPYSATMPSGWDTCPVSQIASVRTTCAYTWDGTTGALEGATYSAGPGSCGEIAAPPGAPSSGEYIWCDSTGHFLQEENSAGATFQMSRELPSGSVRVAGGANGADTPLVLTTTGSSGAATLVGGALNIPQYSGGGGGGGGYRAIDLTESGLDGNGASQGGGPWYTYSAVALNACPGAAGQTCLSFTTNGSSSTSAAKAMPDDVNCGAGLDFYWLGEDPSFSGGTVTMSLQAGFVPSGTTDGSASYTTNSTTITLAGENWVQGHIAFASMPAGCAAGNRLLLIWTWTGGTSMVTDYRVSNVRLRYTASY